MLPYREATWRSFPMYVELPDGRVFDGYVYASVFLKDREIESMWIDTGFIADSEGNILWEKNSNSPAVGSKQEEVDVIEYIDDYLEDKVIEKVKDN